MFLAGKPPAQWRGKRFAGKEKGERMLSLSLLPAGTATVVVGIALGLAGSAAFRATLGLVLEALFLVEVLFAFSEDELRSTVLAGKCLVSHCNIPPHSIFGMNPFLAQRSIESGGGCQKTNQSIPYITGRSHYNTSEKQLQ
jgi:hypothetical protein